MNGAVINTSNVQSTTDRIIEWVKGEKGGAGRPSQGRRGAGGGGEVV